MKENLNQFKHFCVGCNKQIESNEETSVVEIRVGSILYGIFNQAFNYPTQYIHEECYEAYLEKKVTLRSQYAFNCD